MFDGRVDGGDGGGMAAHVGRGWKVIDREMRRVAKRRAALDAEEAKLLVEAKRAEIHKHLGYGSFAEYLERVCGYAPKTARDRIRVAEELENLPVMRAALADGVVCFSTVRELTRVATPHNETAWLSAVANCTVREVEDAVRGHAPGAMPYDRPDPDLEPRTLHLELPPPVYALFLQARRAVEATVGHSMTDADFIAELSRSALEPPRAPRDADTSAPAPLDQSRAAPDGDTPAAAALDRSRAAPDAEARAPATYAGSSTPRYQIAITVCPSCDRAEQHAGGTSHQLAPAQLERVRCDAIELGRVDDGRPPRASSTIPPRIRRAVLARDKGRCTIPGCTSSCFIDVHHIKWRSRGGNHKLQNLTTLCGLHHDAIHDGRLVVTGTAGSLTITHADGRRYGAPPTVTARHDVPPSRVTALAPSDPRLCRTPSPTGGPTHDLVVDAKRALTQLGFRPAQAADAVSRAAAHVGRTVSSNP
jgi:hypothetical protein